jgi:hypothetical protein
MHTVQWQNAVIQQSILSKRRFPCRRSSIGLIAEYSLARVARFRLRNLMLSYGRATPQIMPNRVAFLADESVSVVTVGTVPTQTGDSTHRIHIIGNDGITLCREPPTAVNEGEIVVASQDEAAAANRGGRTHVGWR